MPIIRYWPGQRRHRRIFTTAPFKSPEQPDAARIRARPRPAQPARPVAGPADAGTTRSELPPSELRRAVARRRVLRPGRRQPSGGSSRPGRVLPDWPFSRLSRRSRRRRRSSHHRRRPGRPGPSRPGRLRRRRTAASRCRHGPAGRSTVPMTRSSGGSARRCRRRSGSGTRIGASPQRMPVPSRRVKDGRPRLSRVSRGKSRACLQDGQQPATCPARPASSPVRPARRTGLPRG